MITGVRKLLNVGGGIALSLGALAVAFVTWAIAPFSLKPFDVLRAGEILATAPSAQRIVVGDSRVFLAEPPSEGILFAGFGGATMRNLERFTRTICAVSDAPVTIALGVNDSKRDERNIPASKASLDRIVADCGNRQLALAEIWPVEDGIATRTDGFDMGPIGELTAYTELKSAQGGHAYIPAPDLGAGFSYDGVHFTDQVAVLYANTLARPYLATGGGQ